MQTVGLTGKGLCLPGKNWLFARQCSKTEESIIVLSAGHCGRLCAKPVPAVQNAAIALYLEGLAQGVNRVSPGVFYAEDKHIKTRREKS